MKTENEILMMGDEILTEDKKNPNHITTQLNRDEGISYNTGFHTGFVKGYQKATKWISVKDELPKENIKVLVCLTYGSGKEEIKTSYYSNRTESFDDFMSDIITHWMPLLNPPSKCIG